MSKEALPGALEHPLDEVLHLGAGQHQVRQLVPAPSGDEDPRRVVDPDLLDRRVVEEGLERAEAGHPGDQLADHRVDVTDRCDDAGQAPLVMSTDDGLGQAAYHRRVPLGVDPLAAHGLAHPLVQRLHQVGMTMRGQNRHPIPLPSKRSVEATYDARASRGSGRRKSLWTTEWW